MSKDVGLLNTVYKHIMRIAKNTARKNGKVIKVNNPVKAITVHKDKDGFLVFCWWKTTDIEFDPRFEKMAEMYGSSRNFIYAQRYEMIDDFSYNDIFDYKFIIEDGKIINEDQFMNKEDKDADETVA